MDVPIIVVAVCKWYLGAASRQPDQLSQHAAENVIAGVHSVEHCAKARVEKSLGHREFSDALGKEFCDGQTLRTFG